MLKFKNNYRIILATIFTTATLLLSSESSALAFGKKPVSPPSEEEPVEVIRARWETKNRDGAAWSQYVYDQLPVLGANILAKNPADIASFCPNYANLSTGDKKNFWVYMLSSMSERESAQNPNSTYTESFNDAKGNPVISTGLLQISLESANSYGCGFTSQNQLTDPERNLACGIRILNRWIGNDGVVTGRSGTAWRGGARYWSTLRSTSSSLAVIQSWTQALRICTK
jgi:hypothetical protein